MKQIPHKQHVRGNSVKNKMRGDTRGRYRRSTENPDFIQRSTLYRVQKVHALERFETRGITLVCASGNLISVRKRERRTDNRGQRRRKGENEDG